MRIKPFKTLFLSAHAYRDFMNYNKGIFCSLKTKSLINRLSYSKTNLRRAANNSFWQKRQLTTGTYTPNKASCYQKQLAIVGLGNIGNWCAHMLMLDIASGKLNTIEKIYYIGRDYKKIKAKLADQVHACILRYQYLNSGAKTFTVSLDDVINRFECTEDYSVLNNTNYILTAFGAPMRSIIHDRIDLLAESNRIVEDIAVKLHHFASREATLINITNPLDNITWRLQQLSGLPKENVIGVAGILDSSRLAHAIHGILNVRYSAIDLNSLLVCGEHGSMMVPLLSNVKVNNRPLLEQVTGKQAEAIIKYTRSKGLQMLEELGRVAPHIGPAQAIHITLHAIINGTPANFVASAWNEKYQVFMGSPIHINKNGSLQVQTIPANAEEQVLLQVAADKIKQQMAAFVAFERVSVPKAVASFRS